MRKILAALLIYVSLLSYSQGQNRFSGEQAVENTTSAEKYSDPNIDKYQEQESAQQSGTISKANLCPDGNDQSLDCDCDGIPDASEPNPDEVCGAPNPADPIPIDDYLPFLMITAVGIIVFITHKKKKCYLNFK